MDCACTVDSDIDGGECVKLLGITIPKAKVQHQCRECFRTIPAKEEYIKEVFVDCGKIITWKTCEDCYSLRQVFFSSGWYYGMLWEMIGDFIDAVDGDLSVTCIRQLTKPARDKVLDMVQQLWEQEDE